MDRERPCKMTTCPSILPRIVRGTAPKIFRKTAESNANFGFLYNQHFRPDSLIRRNSSCNAGSPSRFSSRAISTTSRKASSVSWLGSGSPSSVSHVRETLHMQTKLHAPWPPESPQSTGTNTMSLCITYVVRSYQTPFSCRLWTIL